MNKHKIEKLPPVVLALGVAASVVRGVMYLVAVDEKGLLRRGNPLQWLLWLLCAAVAAAVATVIRQKGSNRYEDNFGPSTAGALGSAAMAAGVVLTLLEGNPMPRPGLVLLWIVSGVLAAAGLVWAGAQRMRGTLPNVLCHAVLTLFLALHMVSRYQFWSGNPQAQDWMFSLLAMAGLILCAYGHSTFDAEKGGRRSFLAAGLLTVFLCCAALPHTEYFWLYLCGGIWAFTGLCRVEGIPEPEAAPETE